MTYASSHRRQTKAAKEITRGMQPEATLDVSAVGVGKRYMKSKCYVYTVSIHCSRSLKIFQWYQIIHLSSLTPSQPARVRSTSNSFLLEDVSAPPTGLDTTGTGACGGTFFSKISDLLPWRLRWTESAFASEGRTRVALDDKWLTLVKTPPSLSAALF